MAKAEIRVVGTGDFSQFERALSKAKNSSDAMTTGVRTSFRALSVTIASVTAAAAAVGGALALVNRAAESVSAYQGLAEQIGATAEAVSGLQQAADISGVSLDSVAQASIRLTAALSKTDTESKGAGAALAAINIPLAEFKKLDPVQQLERVSRELARFEDGAGKTAVAVALFGRAGAQLLPFFKDLEEAGGRVNRLTQGQIDAADLYSKAFARTKSELGAFVQTVIVDAIPAFTELLKALNDTAREIRQVSDASKDLTGDNPIREFAFETAAALAVLLEALVAVAKTVRALAGSFEAVWADVRLAGEFLAAGGTIGLLFEKSRKELGEALDRRNETVQEANERYVDLWNYDSTRISRAIRAAQEASRSAFVGPPVPPRGNLAFTDTGEGDKKPPTSEAQRYLEALQKTFETTQQLTTYEQLMWDIQQGRLNGITPQLQAELVAISQIIDSTKALTAEREKEAALDALIASATERDIERNKREAESLQQRADGYLDLIDPMREFIRKLEEIDALVGKELLSEDQAQAIKKRLGDLAEPIDDLSEYAQNAARSMQQAFADFLFDPFEDGIKGLGEQFAKLVQRMVAEAAAAQLMKYLFGDFAQTGVVGGVLGGLATQSPAPITVATPSLGTSAAPALNASPKTIVYQTNNFTPQQSSSDWRVQQGLKDATIAAVSDRRARDSAWTY